MMSLDRLVDENSTGKVNFNYFHACQEFKKKESIIMRGRGLDATDL